MAARSPDGKPIDLVENRRRMAAGELYYAFTPDLIKDRQRCTKATRRFNNTEEPTRRELVTMWKEFVNLTRESARSQYLLQLALMPMRRRCLHQRTTKKRTTRSWRTTHG